MHLLINKIFFLKQEYFIFFMLIFTRIVIVVSTTPFFASRALIPIIKVSLSIFLSIIVSYSLLEVKSIALLKLSFPILILLFIKEVILGFLLSFFLSLIFILYEMAGQFIDLSRGANIAQQLVPELNQESLVMANFLWQMAITLFWTLGLYKNIIESIFLSFDTFSIFEPFLKIDDKEFLYLIPLIVSNLFKISLSIALPVIAISFIIDISFGLLQRISPQINAYFLSLPAKMMAGIFVLWLALLLIFEELTYNNQIIEAYIWRFLKL